MRFNKKYIILCIIVLFISICGVYAILDHQNTDNPIVDSVKNNDTDASGCCSVVVQLENNSSILSYRRDANSTADIHIEQVDWHGYKAIKQYKVDYGYFNHVIVTSDGWIIGLGGIDDGIDNERCENITAEMVNENNTISQDKLEQIQAIKQSYNKGHVVVKAPNGNYGFATPQIVKTGHLDPGQYISMPNHYSFSRSGNIDLNSSDKIEIMTDLARSDMYGLSRRGITIFDFQVNQNNNTTGIYVSNDDGSLFGMTTGYMIDDYYYNNTVIKGGDIPVAPNYKFIDTVTFAPENTTVDNFINIVYIIGFVIFVAILFFVVYHAVRALRYTRRYR